MKFEASAEKFSMWKIMLAVMPKADVVRARSEYRSMGWLVAGGA